MKIAITGHRPHKLDNDYDLTSPLLMNIKEHIQLIVLNHQPTHLISGMALGIDTLFAQLAISMSIPLIAAVPCREQYKMWRRKSIDLYFDILLHPNTKVELITDGEYNNHCMSLRNEWMVDHCNILIAVWNGSSGGTANCVKYAQTKNKEIIYIDPNHLLKTLKIK